MSREKTNDEVRDEFMMAVVEMCIDAVFNPNLDKSEVAERAVFGVLTMLEGSGDFPFCAVIPQPHYGHAAFCQVEGEDWYPCPGVEQEAADQSVLRGEDHHMFVNMYRDALDARGRKKG